MRSFQLQKLGLEHPQEGVFNGHFKLNRAERLSLKISRWSLIKINDPRLTPAVSKKYTIADMITGYMS